MTFSYDGGSNWELKFDDGTVVVLNETEINEIQLMKFDGGVVSEMESHIEALTDVVKEMARLVVSRK